MFAFGVSIVIPSGFSKYIGCLDDEGRPSGQGIERYKNYTREGNWERGELNGFGTLILGEGEFYGDKYVGNFSNGWGEWYSYSRGGGCQCEWYIGCGNYLDYNSSLTINDSGGYLHGDVFNTRTHDSNGDGIGDALQIGSGSYRSHRSNGGCNCWGWGNVCHNTCIAEAYCAIDDPQQKPGAPGGSGGYGGLGQGGNQNRETNGQNGNAGTPKNCPTYATVGNTGGTGGSGGDWAQPGTAGGNDIIPTNSYGRPTGPGPQGGGPGGVAGRSVRGSGYVVAGSTGNVKGTY